MKKNVRSEKSLRGFGYIFIGYLLIIYLFFFKDYKSPFFSFWPSILLGMFISIFLIKPKILLPLSIVWDGFFKILHWINMRIMLGCVFFGIFTPIAIFRHLMNKDSLNLSFDYTKSTYKTSGFNEENNDLRKPY